MKAVGEKYERYGKTAIVVEDTYKRGGCDVCCFLEDICYGSGDMECIADKREDHIPVHFEEVK